MPPNLPTFPPRVLLVMPDQWPRALLRAALREAGYDALGAPGLSGALRYRPITADRGPVGVVVVDQAALGSEGETPQLDALLRRHPGAMPVLLARATMPEPPTDQPGWRMVIRRPASIADIVTTVARLLPLPPGAGRPLD
jgi:hypothetical protein